MCPAPSDPMDCSPLGSSVHGIFQARILEWVAFSPSGDLSDPGIKPGSPALQGDSLPPESREKPLNDVIAAYSDTSSSWSVAHQAPLSVEFSRQEYWSGSSFPAPGNLPHPGIEPHVSCIGRQVLYHCVTWEAILNFNREHDLNG